jgi:hypothetical protein
VSTDRTHKIVDELKNRNVPVRDFLFEGEQYG